VVESPEAPVSLVDDAVSASSRSRVDTEDLHGDRLRTLPDDPSARFLVRDDARARFP
jgi:hypothetical protein